jgi:hypothetical protein
MLGHPMRARPSENTLKHLRLPRVPFFTKLMTDVIRSVTSCDLVSAPLTGMKKIERDVEATFAAVDQTAFAEDLQRLMRYFAAHPEPILKFWSTIAGHHKQQACRDPRYSLLLDVARDASRVSPNLAALVWRPADRDRTLRDQARAAAHVHDASVAKGERRLRQTMSMVVPVIDLVYRPYLMKLVELDSALNEPTSRPDPALGNLVPQAYKRFPRLVDPEAALYRNAAAHSNWADYDDTADTVAIWDDHHDRRVVAVEALLEKVAGMWLLGGPTFAAVADLLFARLLDEMEAGPRMARMMAAACRGDQSTLDAECQELALLQQTALCDARARVAAMASSPVSAPPS